MIDRWPDANLERDMIADAEYLRDRIIDGPAQRLGSQVPLLLTHIRELEGVLQTETASSGNSRPDGTDALLIALYGESSAKTIGKAIGGSNARMLHDAAKRIVELQAEVQQMRGD